MNFDSNTNPVLSIIIPTFKNVRFIEECLDSVIKSAKDQNCEILVGIDGCNDTLNFIESKVFDSKIKFYFFENNSGPYIVMNSLVKIAQGEFLLFFGSDDIMSDNMITEIIRLHRSSFELIRPQYLEFLGTINNKKEKIHLSEGVISIQKKIFLEINGFEPWICAADTDFILRLKRMSLNSTSTDSVNFFRRIHPNSLTQSSETGYKSKLRRDYYLKSKEKKSQITLEKLAVESFIDVSAGTKESDSSEDYTIDWGFLFYDLQEYWSDQERYFKDQEFALNFEDDEDDENVSLIYGTTPFNSFKLIVSKFQKPKRFVVLGSGLGNQNFYWNNLFPDIPTIGIELHPTRFEYSKNLLNKYKLKNIEFINDDYFNFEFEEGDLIWQDNLAISEENCDKLNSKILSKVDNVNIISFQQILQDYRVGQNNILVSKINGTFQGYQVNHMTVATSWAKDQDVYFI